MDISLKGFRLNRRLDVFCILSTAVFLYLTFTVSILFSYCAVGIWFFYATKLHFSTLKQATLKLKGKLSTFTTTLALLLYSIPSLGQTSGAPTSGTTGGSGVGFSVLLSATQAMLETCVLNRITGAIFLSYLLFTALRVLYVVYVARETIEMVQGIKQRQQVGDHVQVIMAAIGGVVILGVIEPFFARSCGSGGTAAPTAPGTGI